MGGMDIAEAVFDGYPTAAIIIEVGTGKVLGINAKAKDLLGAGDTGGDSFEGLFERDADYPAKYFLDDLCNKDRASAIVKCKTGHIHLDGSVINIENKAIGYITLKPVAVVDEAKDTKAGILTGIFRVILELPYSADESEVLEKTATALHRANWDVVKIQLFDGNFRLTHRYIVGLSPEEEKRYLSSAMEPEDRARFFGALFEEFIVGRSYFFPEEKGTGKLDDYGHRPGKRAPLSDDTWKPLDVYRVPIYDDSGDVIGAIDPDDPRNGKRPDPETILLLDLFAESISKSLQIIRSRINESEKLTS